MKKIAIIFADENEFEPFLNAALSIGGTIGNRHSRRCVSTQIGDKAVIAVLCGIGKVNAATATAHIISEEKPDAVLNAGLSGAVRGVYRNDILVGTSYTECDFDISPTGRALGEKPSQESVYYADEHLLSRALTIKGIKSGALGTGDFFLTSSSLKQKYQELFGICAFDMESAAIASACHFADVPYLSIRMISDDADESAAEDYRELNDLKAPDLTELLCDFIKNL